MVGREQRFHPAYSRIERAYIFLLGVPVVGLRIRARILESLLPRDLEPAEILDAGSGPGVLSFLLARRYPRATVLGVDILGEQVENCRTIAERAGACNATFEVADLADIPWRNRFDIIVCVDILEHIEDDELALSQLFHTTAAGGTLYLHVPARYRRYPVFKKRVNFDVPTHVRAGYELGDIEAKVRRAGFQVQRSGFTFGFLETLANNLGYMITRAEKRNKHLYALAFPFLNALGWLGRGARPKGLGAGVFIIGRKARDEEGEDGS